LRPALVSSRAAFEEEGDIVCKDRRAVPATDELWAIGEDGIALSLMKEAPLNQI